MRAAALPLAALAAILAALLGCRRVPATPPAAASPAPTEVTAPATLNQRDVRYYLAVRDRALQRVEGALAQAEKGDEAWLTRVEEISVAERGAASALGVEWRRYRWVKEEIARLLSAQRQREDAKLLALELTRARGNLAAQLQAARDPASRQFLEAQVASLDMQLARLESERQMPEAERGEAALVDGVRAEIALNQGRQEKIQRKLRELLQRSRAVSAPTPAATSAPAPARSTQGSGSP